MPRLGVNSAGNSLIQARKAAKRFKKDLPGKVNRSAIAATSAAKARFASRLADRPRPEGRPGRTQAPGGLGSHIRYQTDGMHVKLDKEKLDRVTRTQKGHPYWMIQEIGTGEAASMKSVTQDGDIKEVPFNVRSQVGRTLSMGLQWHAGSMVFPPLAEVRTHQIEVVSPARLKDMDARHLFARTRYPVQIRKEIQGKHYIQRGTFRGMEVLRDELTELLRATLKPGGK